MSTPKRFRFNLRKGDQYYQVTGNSVMLSLFATALKYAPQEWKKTQIIWRRSDDYIGVVRSASDAYTFVRDGARILRFVSNTEGVEGDCTLEIEKLRTSDLTYQPYYSGKLKFIDCEDTFTAFKASILDGELPAIIAANKDTVYPIPINDADCIKVLMDGVYLLATQNFVGVSTNIDVFLPISGTLPNDGAIIPYASTSTTGDYVIGVGQQQAYYECSPTGLSIGDRLDDGFFANTMFISSRQQNAWFQWKQRLVVSGIGGHDATVSFFIGVADSNQMVTYILPLDTVTATWAGGPVTVTLTGGTAPFDLAEGDRMFLYYTYDARHQILIFPNPNDRVLYSGQLNSTFRTKTTVTKGYRYYQVFQKLITAMTGGKYSGYSDFLSNPAINVVDNRPWYTIMTCGNAFRNFPNPVLKVKWSDLFPDADGRWFMGAGAEEATIGGITQTVWRLEPASYFYDPDTLIADLGQLDWPKITNRAKDYYLNYYAGSKNEANEDKLNGKNEPIGNTQYKLPVLSPTGDLSRISNIRWDMFGIEKLREKQADSSDTDTSTDDTLYLVTISSATDGSGNYLLYRPQNLGTMSGMIFGATAYNLDLTAGRDAERNSSRLHMACYLQESKTMTFQTSTSNSELACDLGYGLISEKADKPVAEMAPMLYIPKTFEAKVSKDLMPLMNGSPKGYFQFTSVSPYGKLVTFRGHIDEVGTNVGDNDVFDMLLTAHRDTNPADFY